MFVLRLTEWSVSFWPPRVKVFGFRPLKFWVTSWNTLDTSKFLSLSVISSIKKSTETNKNNSEARKRKRECWYGQAEKGKWQCAQTGDVDEQQWMLGDFCTLFGALASFCTTWAQNSRPVLLYICSNQIS